MQEQFIANAHVVCRHDEGLAIHDKCDMANEGFIKNAVNQFAVVTAALGLAADFRSFGRSEVCHLCRLAVAGALRQEPILIRGWIDPARESCTLRNAAPHRHSKLRPMETKKP